MSSPTLSPARNKLAVVVLISGRGSNMEAILAASDAPDYPARVVGVVSNRPDAAGLATAQARGIPTRVVNHKDFPAGEAGRAPFDAALAEAVDSLAPDLVVLAGFMRILTPGFVSRYEGRLMNIHPSLLPSFPGLHTHRRALEEGVRVHGCTVHFVTAKLDHGPIILQAAVPVLDGDTEPTLSARVLAEEHRIYPRAVAWFAAGRLSVVDGRVQVAGSASQSGAVLHSPSGA
ncbi:phosphoribosylglycinamide formyltransferase [Oryzomicrobium terrae]|uniref:Phosphoribosylglycinamide formyltransferase n=1 Tax=Oryzomicrobium terrae TaxID=1735038 RepID=A0A5C1EAX4_9RHOO|nr:phosphoribosylglycinamide formyltransferase [Oryzomicrobium terrae]QEL65824.1 phosphoribosylglycinamide formyltransferase [Oryzomicrobium terrae]